jgi:predicted SprT family Zn-dependent metalloprotease
MTDAIHKYKCHCCGDTHLTEERARTCCPLEDVWECDNCGSEWSTASDANECCADEEEEEEEGDDE